jgi:hypothetical protein
MTETNNTINRSYSEGATDHPYFSELIHSLKIQGISALSMCGSIGAAAVAITSDNYPAALISLGGFAAGMALCRRDGRLNEMRGNDLDRLIIEDNLGDGSE